MDYSFSSKDINDLMKGSCKILSYSDLHKYKSIDDVLAPCGYFVILYLTEKNYGHWVCVLESPSGAVEVFDSYGEFKPDEEQDFIHPSFKRQSYQDQPYLAELLYQSGRKIEYNDYPFQKFADGINTCGRWCVARLNMRRYTLEEFTELFRHVSDDDLCDIIY